MESPQTTTRNAFLRTAPGNAFSKTDTTPYVELDFAKASPDEISQTLGLSMSEAKKLQPWLRRYDASKALKPTGLKRATAELLSRHIAFRALPKFIVTNVTAEPTYLLSNRTFTLLIHFLNQGEPPVEFLSINVAWAGEPFTVQQVIQPGEQRKGQVAVAFDSTRTLPVGLAEFTVDLFRGDGSQASFVKSFYVLPANPLSLQVAPAGATVTGTWSVRGAFQPATNTFLTECLVTVANGDAVPVTMKRRVNWSFWDGPVGSGTLVESGGFDLGSAPVVPAFSTWQASFWFSSPAGSGIHNKYKAKEDLAIEIRMESAAGRVVSGQITARVMLAYGVNIIKVGDFGAQEHNDLYTAVDQMRQIYERRDITLRGVQRYIINNAQAGGFTVLDSETEFRNLLSGWSVQNDFVDVYVCQAFNWSTFNGYAGDIPGPTSKTGNKDGIAVDKTGFTDASGVRRLNTAVLSQLIGHEVGHYLGLQHLEDTNNLMRSNTGVRGPNLDYNQYRTMLPHGYMVFI
ncbi:hypothetical protein FAES_2320 [Fibrella aestuarina BUZ 2]|uniref:Uncharacterized protein n=1 Tax=Fibrella aestuarina BUZ 2 TaxID=1166018 RepID=I0K876_9BACT|nr:hypothetical protein FAES_2320 [Fibrella aestuarina BUZ 2]